MKQSSLIRLLLISNILLLSFVAFVLFSSFENKSNNDQFEEITVKRINVVNNDGTPVMVIANKQRMASPVIEGKQYPVSVVEGREYMAGIIFFNEAGDEMGGLTFNSFRMPNGKIAGIGHLSFDRFNDNQVLALQYNENKNGVKTGLSIFDRPGDGTFKKYMDLLEEYNQISTSPSRKITIKAVLKEMTDNKQLGSQRLFIGSNNEMAQIELKDNKGLVKARLYVDEKGEARLSFFNDKGDVIAGFPK